MGQELSSRLQVTTFPVSAILLLRHRVNSAQSQQQLVVFIEGASRDVLLFMMKPELGGDTPMSSCRGYSPQLPMEVMARG